MEESRVGSMAGRIAEGEEAGGKCSEMEEGG